jgi:hypothetical protein
LSKEDFMKEERSVFTRFGLSKIFSISNIIGFFVWGNKDIDPELVCNACYKSEKNATKKFHLGKS